MSELKVTLFKITPEVNAAKAARVCTEDIDIHTLFNDDTKTVEENLQILKRVVSMGHVSVIEHLDFTFLVSGISRALSHQLVRHRIASYSQQSQRYISMKNASYVTPPSIRNHPDPKVLQAYQAMMESMWVAYESLVDDYGIPGEDARFLLPNACTTQIVITMNARQILHFLEERLCSCAQWEARRLAQEMLRQLQATTLEVFKNAGPKCARELFCTQGIPRWSNCRKAPHKSQIEALGGLEAVINKAECYKGLCD